MSMILRLRFFILAFLVPFGCSKVYSTKFILPMKEKVVKVAILPFNDLTGGSADSSAISKFFVQEIEKRYGIKAIEGDELKRKLSEKWMTLEDTSNRFIAYKAAQVLEADAVLFGSVLESRYRRIFSNKGGVHEDPVVCLSARLVEGKTGTVFWSKTSEMASYNVIRSKVDSLAKLTALTVKDLVKSMKFNKK